MSARNALPVSERLSAKAVHGTNMRGDVDRSQSLGRVRPSERSGFTVAAANLCCAEQAFLLIGDAVAQNAIGADRKLMGDGVVGDDLSGRAGVRRQVLVEATPRSGAS